MIIWLGSSELMKYYGKKRYYRLVNEGDKLRIYLSQGKRSDQTVSTFTGWLPMERSHEGLCPSLLNAVIIRTQLVKRIFPCRCELWELHTKHYNCVVKTVSQVVFGFIILYNLLNAMPEAADRISEPNNQLRHRAHQFACCQQHELWVVHSFDLTWW